jgi:hypothetical protein
MVIKDRGGKSGGGAAKAVGLTSGGLLCVSKRSGDYTSHQSIGAPHFEEIRRFTPARLTSAGANRLEASVQGPWNA